MRHFVLVSGLVMGVGALACSAGEASNEATGSESEGGVPPYGGASASGGAPSAAGLGGAAGSLPSGGTSAGGSCQARYVVAAPVSSGDLFVMMDQSTAMSLADGSGGTRWSTTIAALSNFVQHPASAGL